MYHNGVPGNEAQVDRGESSDKIRSMLPVYSDTPRLKRNSLNSGWLPQTAVENGLKIRLDPPRIANNSKWNCAKVKRADNPEL